MTEKKRTEAFLASVSYDGDVEAKRIREEADREREERLAACREAAEKTVAEAVSREEERSRKRRAAQISSAVAEARAIGAKAREDGAVTVIRRAREMLDAFRKTDAYADYLRGAAKRIAQITEGQDDRVILIGEEDEPFSDMMTEASGGIPVRVSGAVTGGGAVGDSRAVRCDLTFDAALEERKEEIRRAIAFGEVTEP